MCQPVHLILTYSVISTKLSDYSHFGKDILEKKNVGPVSVCMNTQHLDKNCKTDTT